MTLMHMALGALTSIFGAHLSWAVTDLIIKRKRDGRSVVVPTLLSVAGVIVIVVTCGVSVIQHRLNEVAKITPGSGLTAQSGWV